MRHGNAASGPAGDMYQMIGPWYQKVHGLMADNYHNLFFLRPGTPSTLDFSRLNSREKGLEAYRFREYITRPGAYTGNKSYMFGATKRLIKEVGALRREGIAIAEYLIGQADVFPDMTFKLGSMVGEALDWLGFVFPVITGTNGSMKGTVHRGGYFRVMRETAGELFEVMADIAEEQEAAKDEDDGWKMFEIPDEYTPDEDHGEEPGCHASPDKPYDFDEADEGRLSPVKVMDLRKLDRLILLAEFGETGVYNEIEELCGLWDIDLEAVDSYLDSRENDYDSRVKDFFEKKDRLERIEVLHILDNIVREGVSRNELGTLEAHSGMITKLAISLAQSFEDDPSKGPYCPEWIMAFRACERLESYLSRNGR